MDDLGSCPSEDLARVDRGQERFSGVIADTIRQADVARPSLLPGWTVGHVLSHVARNADSHRRRAEAATRGEIVEQYAGGFDGRSAEIDTGAGRTAAALIADVSDSAERLRSAWLEVPGRVWDAPTRDVRGVERPLNQLPARRWHELEVHVVDLRVGITPREWSSDFVSVWLPRHRLSASHRLPKGTLLPVELGFADERDELAWLLGRLDRPDLPPLTPWG